MSSLIMFCGLPGVGKTSLRKDMLSKMDTKRKNEVFIFTTDDMIEILAEEQNKSYQEVFKDYIKESSDLMYNNLEEAIKNDMDIIHDQTNLYPSKRVSVLGYLKKAKKFNFYVKICVYFRISNDITYNDILPRLNKSGHGIDDETWNSMRERLSPPSKEEGWDDIKIIEVSI